MSDMSAMKVDNGLQDGVWNVPWGVLSAMSIAGVILVLVGTSRYGIGISPDSAGYLCAARNLLAGRGYWTVCNSPYTAWPPLFPTVLAAIGLTGIDPAVGARLLNAFAMGGIVYFSGAFFRRCLRSRLLVVVGTCSILLSFPLLGICSMMWTEPLFVLLILSFILAISAFLRDRRVASLVAAAVLAALCALQRYTGVTLIGAGALLILWPRSNTALRSRLRQVGCFGAISSTPLGFWMVRNYRLTAMATGHVRQHSIYSIWENVASAADTVTAWFIPQTVLLAMRVGILGGVIVLIVGSLLLLRKKAGGGPYRDREYVWTTGLVILVYIPLILYTHQIGVLDETMNDRYLAPLAVLLLWLLFAGIDDAVARLSVYPLWGRVIAWSLLTLCVLWLKHPLQRTGAMVVDQVRDGAGGYNRTAWRESPLVKWLDAHPLQGPIRSNAPDALYALTGRDANVSPHRTWDMAEFQRVTAAGRGETLVWFRNSARSFLYDLDELVSIVPVEKVAAFRDGGVYRLVPAKGATAGAGAFSPYLVNGTRNRRFTSDTFGPRGLIASWVLRDDGRMESVWELNVAEGDVITWNPCCEYSRSGDAFEFFCEGMATRTREEASIPYRFSVHGTIRGDAALGEYRIEFCRAREPACDRGHWRVDVAHPVYRLYSSRRRIHAYVLGRQKAVEVMRQPGGDWLDEGPVFCVYPEGSQPPEAQPVFRLTSKTTGADFYTISEAERGQAMGNPRAWDYTGIAWYAYPPEYHPPGTTAVHRFWSGILSTHFYTMNENEKEKLVSDFSRVWTYEGIVWHAIPVDGL